MDNTLKKSDISKRILETRKQTEELKAQLQNLIDSGINSSLEYKTTVHSHLDKENIKESENKVQIIKSYDTKHSQHITKPSSSRINLPETLKNVKLESQQKNSKKTRNYDINEARDYIKKQKEKRLEQHKLQNEEKKKAEIKKQKLQELHKKSLELVAKNVQVKRERSKSRERIDFVRPVKDIPRSRSSSQEKGVNRHKPDLNDNYGRRGKSVERSRNMQLENVSSINPNLLYPPQPTYLLKIQEQKSRLSNKKSPTSLNKIVILSGNSTDKKTESPNSDLKTEKELLKPKNLFNTAKNTSTLYPASQNCELNAQMQIANSNKSPDSNVNNETELTKPNLFNSSKNTNTLYPPSQNELNAQMRISNTSKDAEKIVVANKNSSHHNSTHKTPAINSNNSAAGKVKSRKLDYNSTKQKILSPKNIEVPHLTNGKSPLEIESNNNFAAVTNILDYKTTQNKNSSNINLQSLGNVNLITSKHSNLSKLDGTPKSGIAIDTDNLEKFTKETQTNDEPKREFPSWLQENRFESNPLNFINTVKRKLHYAINSPTTYVDVGVQSSIAQQNFKADTQNIKSKEEIFDILQHSAKSSKRSDLKSFISHKCLNLDKKTIDNIELIPKNFSSRHLTSSKDTETGSESDTSKNIPEISSESGTSLKKNADSVKQNGSVGLDVERLTSLKLRAHNVDKNTHTIQAEEIRTEPTPHPYSTVINDKSPIKINFDDALITKTETKGSVSKINENDQYTSDFQTSSRSISTHSSLMQNKTSINSSKSAGYQNLMDPQVMLYSEKHSNNIPKSSDRHSNNTTTNIMTNSENEKLVSSRNITVRNNSLGKNISHTPIESNNSKDISTNKKTISNDTSIVTETQGSKNKFEESQLSEPITSIASSKKSDKYKSLYSDFNPSATVNEMLSKSDSNLQYINTRRGSHLSSENNKFLSILPLKEPTLSLVVANEKITQKSNKNEDKSKLLKNISLKSATNEFVDQNNTNEIHLKFEAEIHLLNDFNESLRQFSEVEKAFNSLKSKNDATGAANKILHNQDTQTSIVTKSSSTTSKATENSDSDKSELSSINFSRFLINADSSSLNVDTTVSKVDETNADDALNININQDLCNFENLQSHNFAGMTLRMFEQLIKDEDVRLENLKTILKIREQALLDRTKGELAWLEIQRKHLRETGKLHEASLIKKKQRGILVNHQKERHEMQRLKQMQKAASIERKIILKEQRNFIKNQLSTDKMLSKIKVNTPRERRLSGPLKVIQSHTESIRSETSFSRRSSSEKEKETYSVMSHTQSIVSMVSEVSAGEELIQKDGTPRADSTDLVMKLPSEAGGVPISQMKRTLLIREVALQKRRKAALELLQWHRKLLEEEKRITELESTANTIISQIPNNAPASPDATEKYQFRGKQLNQLWLNLTGCKEKKFSENKIYPMSQIALERFCKSAREYSSRTKASNQVSDSEVSEYSVMRTDDSLSENIPDRKVTHSASIRTESGLSQESSDKNQSVPVTTANDYTSDFDIESLQDIVNIEDVDVVDKSINQLIDNFSKIQDDISSLSIKQSQKSDVDLEPDESIRSEKTDSEVEISVIETTKTSKERSFEEADLKLVEYNKITNSSQTLSTLEDINDSYNNNTDVKTANERSKSTQDKIVIEMPDLVSSFEVPPVGENEDAKLEFDESDNKSSYPSTYDKVPSIIEENALNIEGKNNLNTSKEILNELSYLESQIEEDLPPDALEDVEIIYKAKDNLSKTEEILSRLSQSEPKHSIISSRDDKYPLESDMKISLDKNSASESEGVLLNLRPLENEVSNDVSSTPVLSKQDAESSEDGKTLSIDTSDNLLSDKTPVTEDNIIENIESKDAHIVLNEEKIDLRSEILSETPIPTEGSSATRETSVKSSEQAVNDISEPHKILSILQDDFVISDGNENKKDKDDSRSISGHNILQFEQSRTEEVAKLSHEDEDITSEKEQKSLHFLPTEEISEVLEEKTDINEGLLMDKNTKSDSYTKPLEEDVTEIKDEISDKVKSVNSFNNTESYEENDTQEKVTNLSSNKETEIVTEASEKFLEENNESKSSATKILLERSLAEPQSEKHLEENVEDVISQQIVPDIIPSVIEETDKSQVTSVPENLASLLSKEDINSFEEKELDSLSSSTTGSQSSMLSEREESQFSEKSKTSISEEKSSRSEAVDVKKRVSEIMADANQGSRGDKSPKLQDFYTTTYDLVSPANSPELGSPTEEHKYITAKSIFGTEAEEILRKQLAIEQEIKQITEQQQKEQLPYLFVREIPNKPPPPYTPPTSVPAANVITIIPTSDEIENITKYSAKILYKAYLSKNLENISISENTLSLISKDITKECYKFVFDLCKEISKEHYKQFEKEECVAWLQVKKNPRLAVVKPLDVTGLEKHMNKKLKELFGYEKPVRRENTIIKWSRKKRDHVDEILVMESQAEETQWTNYDKDELLVMNEVTNEIMNMLLKETGEVFNKILSKQTF